MKKTDTWMPLYVGDYIADTAHLTTEQHGAYLLILMALWKRGGEGLPDIDENMAAASRLPVARWRAIRPVLVDGVLLRAEGGCITQKRLAAEVLKARGITDARSKAGAAGAAKREANRDAKPQANDKQTSTPSQSQEPQFSSRTPVLNPPSSDSPVSPPSAEPVYPPTFDGRNAEALNGKAVVPIAAGWELPEQWGNDAEALGWKPPEVLREAERFRQYWVSGKGSGKRRSVKGWRQAWSNWLGRAAQDQR